MGDSTRGNASALARNAKSENITPSVGYSLGPGHSSGLRGVSSNLLAY